jgi:hypothetical protein
MKSSTVALIVCYCLIEIVKATTIFYSLRFDSSASSVQIQSYNTTTNSFVSTLSTITLQSSSSLKNPTVQWTTSFKNNLYFAIGDEQTTIVLLYNSDTKLELQQVLKFNTSMEFSNIAYIDISLIGITNSKDKYFLVRINGQNLSLQSIMELDGTHACTGSVSSAVLLKNNYVFQTSDFCTYSVDLQSLVVTEAKVAMHFNNLMTQSLDQQDHLFFVVTRAGVMFGELDIRTLARTGQEHVIFGCLDGTLDQVVQDKPNSLLYLYASENNQMKVKVFNVEQLQVIQTRIFSAPISPFYLFSIQN